MLNVRTRVAVAVLKRWDVRKLRRLHRLMLHWLTLAP